MNNFELDAAAQAMAETTTPYQLAKRVIKAESKLNELKAIVKQAQEIGETE